MLLGIIINTTCYIIAIAIAIKTGIISKSETFKSAIITALLGTALSTVATIALNLLLALLITQ